MDIEDSPDSKKSYRELSPCLFCGNPPNGCWCDRVFLQLANKRAYKDLPDNQLGLEDDDISVNEWQPEWETLR